MDRATGVLLLLILLGVFGLFFMMYTMLQVPSGKQEIVLRPVEYPTSTVKVPVILKEGVGPNAGEKIDGNVYAYYTEITDVYDIPADAMLADSAATTNGEVELVFGFDPDYASNGTLKIWLVAEANNHYKAMATVEALDKTPDDTRIYTTPVVTMKLDAIATMSWTADDAYRGVDSPILRWKTADEVYKSIFEIRPTIDFTTDRPSGVFLVEKVSILGDVNADYTNVDTIDVTVGSVEFSALSAADLPETQRLTDLIRVTREDPLAVTVTVTTTDGTASLTSGQTLLYVKIVDVLGNEFQVPVKVA